jgi:hypothetical protein
MSGCWLNWLQNYALKFILKSIRIQINRAIKNPGNAKRYVQAQNQVGHLSKFP